MIPAASCNPLMPASCAKDAVGDAVSGAADSFMEKLVQSTLDGLVEIVGTFGTSMFAVDSPNVGTDEGQASATLAAVSSSLEWVVFFVGSLAMMAAVIRMFWTLDAGTEGRVIIRMMINLVASSSLVIGMTALLIEASDKFSLWALYAISGHDEADLNSGEKFSKALLGNDIVTDGQVLQGLGLIAIILILVAAAGSIMQFLWMIVRSPLIIATMAFIPSFAASSGFRTGQERFNKALMFLLACILYKPVAAVLYGLGLRMMKAQDEGSEPLQQFMWGTTLLLLVGLAGPAMVKFFVAEAAVGTSNAFSGAAGIAAGGAAVYGAASLGAALATGGGSAAAGAGKGAAVATPPAGGGGPAPSTGGGGATPPAPGGGGGGTPPLAPVASGPSATGADANGGGETPSGAGASGGGAPQVAPPSEDDSGSSDGGPAVVGAGSSGGSSGSAASTASGARGRSTGAAGSSATSGQRDEGAANSGASTETSTPGADTGAASGTGAPVAGPGQRASGGARLAGSRAKRSAQRGWQSGMGAVTASGAAIDEMSESARAGSATRGR